MKTFTSIIFGLILSSCGLFDSGSEEIVGEYTIGWIDTGCTRTIRFGQIGQMSGEIYAIGWNNNFIIAKRHPNCNKDQTDYFIIDIEKNIVRGKKEVNGMKNMPCIYDCGFGVFGPYDKKYFNLKRTELGIPVELQFTKNY